jgi:hypothetical protein
LKADVPLEGTYEDPEQACHKRRAAM